MADVPAEAPEHCPGTKSETAGKVSACHGCPNQTICASGTARGPDPSIALIQARMADVKHKILILSGKGGVGKSTFTSMLARGLAASDANTNVAVLDIDICGPSMPRMLGVVDEQVHQSGSGWSPVYVEENLSVMSVGFLLSSPDDAIIWRGPKKNGMIKQFLSQVDWTGMDYMVLDTPPGTSDEHLSAVQFLSGCGLTGAVVVSTPQEVSLLDVRKEVDACHKLGVPVLGVVENMAGFVCPHCKTESQIFPANTGGVRQLAIDMSIPFLGSLPLDPLLARACDQGEAPAVLGPAWQAFQSILKKIMQTCEQ